MEIAMFESSVPHDDHTQAGLVSALRLAHRASGDGFHVTVAGDGDFRFVFETDGSRVTRYHLGITPAVEWVEGCS